MADSDRSRLLTRRLFLAGAGGALTASALAPAIVEAAPRLAGDDSALYRKKTKKCLGLDRS